MRYNIFIIILCLTFSMVGQNNSGRFVKLGHQTMIDRSFMECVYEHFVYDPIADKSQCEDWILEIGHKASRYGYYNKYQLDSLFAVDYPKGVTMHDFDQATKRFGRPRTTESFKSFGENKFSHYESILMDQYCYEESIPVINWHLIADETEEVCGYQCKKAVAEFRGRTWTAWYCEDISVNNGPWIFGGLSGLIMKLEDSNKEHSFEAVQIRKGNKEFGKKSRSSLIKVDRKQFREVESEYRTNTKSFLSANPQAPKANDGSAIPNRRLFFNPIELD